MVSNDEIKKKLEAKRKEIGLSKEEKNINNESLAKQTNTFDQIKSWWDKRNTNEKALSGLVACCIGVFLFILVIGALAPESTALSVSNANAQIDDKTTEYVINGTADSTAKVYIASSDLNLTKVEVTVDKTGKFSYKLTIPVNITDLSVEVSAVAPEKVEVSQTVNIQRPLTPLSVKPTPALTADNKTVIMGGITDPQAEVKISSTDLNINETKVNVDSNGNFKYTINVPRSVSSASVLVTAKSVGKKLNTQSEVVVREYTPSTSTTDTNTNKDTGSSDDSSDSSSSSSSSSKSYGDYIANSNTGKFHYASCYWVTRMNEEHKVSYNSREDAINAGYIPCKVCNP